MSTKTAYRLATATDALSKLLPDAEAEIMQIIWQQGRTTVKRVHRIRAEQRDLAYTTTMTTMVRLVAKGLLQRGSRHGSGGAYSYTPATSEQVFVAERLAEILGAIERDYPAVLAHRRWGRGQQRPSPKPHPCPGLVQAPAVRAGALCFHEVSS
jgi:predicted transcriptional regulator